MEIQPVPMEIQPVPMEIQPVPVPMETQPMPTPGGQHVVEMWVEKKTVGLCQEVVHLLLQEETLIDLGKHPLSKHYHLEWGIMQPHDPC